MSHTVYLCVGLPGSGKSTHSKVVELASFYANPAEQVVRVNQDALGSRGKCIMTMSFALQEGKQAIVDRCNVTRDQRSFWIKLAKEHGYRVVVEQFNVPPEVCLERCNHRIGHETMTEQTDFKRIIYGFYHSWEPPEFNEGIDQINLRNASGKIIHTITRGTSDKLTLWQAIKRWWNS